MKHFSVFLRDFLILVFLCKKETSKITIFSLFWLCKSHKAEAKRKQISWNLLPEYFQKMIGNWI